MKKIFKDIEDNFCAAILLAMLILTFVNVVARKLLNSSMPFVEELTTCGPDDAQHHRGRDGG